jgi:predicted nucleotidyltransferase
MAERGVIDLCERDRAIVHGILEKYVPGRPVFVFGSRANGRAKRRSDLDLAIGGEKPLTMRVLGQLADAFDQSDLPIEVDVVDVNEVSETFRSRMVSEWVELLPSSLAAPVEVVA